MSSFVVLCAIYLWSLVFGEDLPRAPDLLVSCVADYLRMMARPWLRVRALVN